jgi:para-nitrobenzyl esterase
MDGLTASTAGNVRGVFEGGVWAYKGIPYASDPSGPGRWRKPQAPLRWAGIREADTFGSIAPQAPPVPGMSITGDPTERSEDCLSLNVWTPAPDDNGRPVLVWIHGGGFTSGSGSSLLYRGGRLARLGDVVVVTINYRLGALGFLAHPGLAEPEGGWANWGLLDQLAALEWVQENIGNFGGDPGNVTVFGESAGGISISALLVAPAATGMFHRAVIQSGPPACGSASWARRRGSRFVSLLTGWAEEVGGEFDRGHLENIPAESLVSATQGFEADASELPLPFLPVADGGVLRGSPVDVIRENAGHHVPVLVGTNRDECTFFALSDKRAASLDAETLRRRMTTLVGGSDTADEIVEGYRKARDSRGEGISALDLWTAITTDLVFRMPSLSLAEAQAETGVPVYSYLFTWSSPFLGGILRSAHALEVPFVFGSVAERAIQPYSGSGPAAETLSHAMMRGWLSFASTGNPSCEELGDWPRYDATRRQTMVLGEQSFVEEDPRGEERGQWSISGVDMGNRLYHS